MSSRRVSLPNDPQTLRFYLGGIHHFSRWYQLETQVVLRHMPLLEGVAQFLRALQAILQPLLGPQRGTNQPAVITAAEVCSVEKPFRASSAFVAIQPFLDGQEIAAALARIQAAAEAIGPLPSGRESPFPLFDNIHRRSIKVMKQGPSQPPSREENERRRQQHEEHERHRNEEQERLQNLKEAFAQLIVPFDELRQRIVLKLADKTKDQDLKEAENRALGETEDRAPAVGEAPTPAEPFIPTPLQTEILTALTGRGLKKQQLADEVCAGEGTRLYKRGGIKELRAADLVKHKPGVGYYRPDAPPAEAVILARHQTGTN